jgi:hypothetical protein
MPKLLMDAETIAVVHGTSGGGPPEQRRITSGSKRTQSRAAAEPLAWAML